jgi:hypothetical protein
MIFRFNRCKIFFCAGVALLAGTMSECRVITNIYLFS